MCRLIKIILCSLMCNALLLQGMQDSSVTRLIHAMKALVSLSGTNRYFNSFLNTSTIADLCKNYDQDIKDKTLQSIIDTVQHFKYRSKRVPLYILIYAGANPNTTRSYSSECVLLDAILENDDQLVNLLLEHGADPNAKIALETSWIFFYAKKKEIAHMLIKKGANLDTTLRFQKENVLWHIISDDIYPAELLDLYIEHGADVMQLHEEDTGSLLHWLPRYTYYLKTNDNFLKKAFILVKAMQQKINIKNNKRQTPLDCVKECFVRVKQFLKKRKFSGTGPQALELLDQLYSFNGAVLGHQVPYRGAVSYYENEGKPRRPLWDQEENDSCITS